MIKLFASDLDGTLLNIRHVVDTTILAALHEVTDSGAHFAIATGRCMRSNHDFGFDDVACEAVCSNGSIILDRKGRCIHHMPLDAACVEEILLAFPTISFDFTSPTTSYIRGSKAEHALSMRHPSFWKRVAMQGMGSGPQMSHPETFVYNASMEQILSEDVCKINCRVPDVGLAQDLHDFLADHRDSLVNAPFDASMFEITDVHTNKGAAVAWLAAYLGIAESEVAVYGDGGNDVAMLERFAPLGHAYAPRGGGEAARQAASSVIGYCAFHAVPRHMVETIHQQTQP